MRRPAVVLLSLTLAGLAFAAPNGPELDPYRALSTSPAGARLIAVAQSALAANDAPRLTEAEWPGSPRPVYVTLVRSGRTRACLGSDSPLGSLSYTVHALAARLRTDDRRHTPVGEDELEQLRLVIAFAGESEPIVDPYRTDPMREGLRIETERGAIAFLPGEARTVSWALREARRVGVLAGADSEARYSRFAVVTLSGPARPPSRD